MPRIHLGVYLTSGKETVDAVKWALEAGYRAVDSAQMYRNEREVGSAIQSFFSSPSNESSLKREDIHFTSKLASNISYDAARKSIKQSVKSSGLGYIDLFLLHSPYGGKTKRLDCWRAVEDAIDEGDIKTGGVSNFGVKHVGSKSEAGGCRCLRATISCKSYSPPNHVYSLQSTRSRCIHSIHARQSLRSVRITTLSSKRTLRWHVHFG